MSAAKQYRRLLRNHEWFSFADKVKARDGNKCAVCGRGEDSGVTLQVHHERYDPGLLPWEYPIEDCTTLCSGCHARDHGIIPPDNGWHLVSIDDLGDLGGHCERPGCGQEIRYEHLTYHPQWGYMKVGSTCVEHLTEEDQALVKTVERIRNRAADFARNTEWKEGVSSDGVNYLYCTYGKHHQIRVYRNGDRFGLQTVIKPRGCNGLEQSGRFSGVHGNLTATKELGYIMMRGMLSDDEDEKEILRSVYRAHH